MSRITAYANFTSTVFGAQTFFEALVVAEEISKLYSPIQKQFGAQLSALSAAAKNLELGLTLPQFISELGTIQTKFKFNRVSWNSLSIQLTAYKALRGCANLVGTLAFALLALKEYRCLPFNAKRLDQAEEIGGAFFAVSDVLSIWTQIQKNNLTKLGVAQPLYRKRLLKIASSLSALAPYCIEYFLQNGVWKQRSLLASRICKIAFRVWVQIYKEENGKKKGE